MKTTILLPLSLVLFVAAGCSTSSTMASAPATPAAQESPAAPKANASAYEGVWKGREVTADHEGPASLTLTSQTLEFHGPDAGDWVKGTYTLREDTNPKQLIGTITESDASDIIGKKIHAIYKIENGTLTIAGNGPDDPDSPTAFGAAGSRQFVLKRAP